MGRLTHHTGKGWTYFVTTKAWQRTFLLQVEEMAKIIMAKMLEIRERGSYLLHDFVVMPNPLHLILTPAPSVSLEKAVQLINGGSSHEIHKVRGTNLQIWQSEFHESRVTSGTEHHKKRDYIYFPVAANLVERPEAWVFGSASGKFTLDTIFQELKPMVAAHLKVGPEGPSPGTLRESPANSSRGLKLPPPKETGLKNLPLAGGLDGQRKA